MKKIGMIGGLTFASTAESYRLIAEKANQYLCGYQTAEILLISVNPEKIFTDMHKGNWIAVTDDLVKIATDLERLGAECIMMPCNSAHKVSRELQKKLSVPFINIMDSVGHYIKRHRYKTVGLLGTLFTMESGFYQAHLKNHFQINTLIPDENDRIKLHQIIFGEICQGDFNSDAKAFVRDLCLKMSQQMNCDAIILGCTELPLMVKQDEVGVALINTLSVHAEDVVDFAIKNTDINYVNASGM